MKRCALIIGLLMMTIGCGPGMMYPHLDWLIPRYVSDYISLDSEQKSMLQERLARQIDWHCRTQLAGYSGFLRALEKDLAQPQRPVTYQQLDAHYIHLQQYWNALIRQVAPDAADILATATDDQIEELYSNLDKRNEKFRAEYIAQPSEKLIAQRTERMIKRLQYWLSRLTTDQKQAVAQWSRQLEPTATDRLHNREKFQAEVRRLLVRRNTGPAFKQRIVAILVHPEQLQSAAYRQKIDHNTVATLKLMAAILGLRTPAQQSYLSKRIATLAEEFDRLSCVPEATGTVGPNSGKGG